MNALNDILQQISTDKKNYEFKPTIVPNNAPGNGRRPHTAHTVSIAPIKQSAQDDFSWLTNANVVASKSTDNVAGTHSMYTRDIRRAQ